MHTLIRGSYILTACLTGTLLPSLTGCGESQSPTAAAPPVLSFSSPAARQLSQTGSIPIELPLPAGGSLETLTVNLDGMPVTSALTVSGTVAHGSLADVGAGEHQLAAAMTVAGTSVQAAVAFEAVALTNPDACEILNQAECLLPYPSSRFFEPASTATGVHLKFPTLGMPVQNGEPLSPAPYADLDGFSPGTQILMHFPGNVDVGLSNAARLHAETRTTDLRSLDADSPTVLVDCGHRRTYPALRRARRHRHRAAGAPGTVSAPGQGSDAGPSLHRRRPPCGPRRTAVRCNPSRRLRPCATGGQRTSRRWPRRRAHFEDLFAAFADLQRAPRRPGARLRLRGAERPETHRRQMLSMRDQAFVWLAQQNAATMQTFTVDDVVEADCSLPDTDIWRRGGRNL